MESIYYPYTKVQAIDITARYYGISKSEAKRQLEKDNAYQGERISLMEQGLKAEAVASFYND